MIEGDDAIGIVTTGKYSAYFDAGIGYVRFTVADV